MMTTLPDYRGGSIVNLMSSIAAAFGGIGTPYPPLKALDPETLRGAKNIVLLVVDGLGLDTLIRAGAGGSLEGHLKARLTSVFPSTTATAVTSLLTGVAPQQHGLTGWHMYFREIGAIAAVLPLTPRHGGPTLREVGIDPAALLGGQAFFDRLAVTTDVVAPARIVNSDFNAHYCGLAKRVGYDTLEQCFSLIAERLREPGGRRFIHAYYPTLDATAHSFGIHSDQVRIRFARLDTAFAAFLKTISGSDTTVIVTADHGFIDSPPEHLIELHEHPQLEKMLVLPLCGERRVAYCYIHPHRREEFEAYVASEFAGRATLMKSEDLISQGWFGLGMPHPRLGQRIGHYTLLMQEDWTIRDRLPGERDHALIGVHGGISAAEMFVPLILALA